MVPLSGREADSVVMELACKLAKLNKGKVHAVHVIQVKRSLPLDVELEPEIRRAEALFKMAEDIADQQDCPIETELLQSREIGPALVEEAVQQGVDLILMSVEYKKRFGEFMLGDAASYTLKNAPCPVCILRHLPPQQQ